MAGTAHEAYVGRSLNGKSGQMIYAVTGTTSEAAARAAALAAAPAAHPAYSDLGRVNSATEVLKLTEHHGGGFLVTVHYEHPDAAEPTHDTGDTLNTFEIGGGSLHISQAVAHVQHYEPGGIGGSGPDYQGAINVISRDNKPEVQGVDVPQLEGAQILNLQRWIANASFTADYRRAASRLALHTNDAAFTITGVSEFEEAEVLFLGLSAAQRGAAQDWDVTYRFAIRENLANAVVNWPAAAKPSAAVPKKGWQYLWCSYKDGEDANILVPRIRSINVERVFLYGDFTALNP